MEKLITEVFDLIKDYRSDEWLPNVKMTEGRIKRWIEQFDNDDRTCILTELKNIFNKRYCSKDAVKQFLKGLIFKLKEDLKYSSPKEFLQNSFFLNLQPAGKSQDIMLKLLSGILLLEAIGERTAELICAYIFIHEKNYHKKKAEMRHKIGDAVSLNHKMYRMVEVENDTGKISSSLDFLFPVETNEQDIHDYKSKIILQVDEYTEKYSKKSPEEFYRNEERPLKENLFTSPESRDRFENVVLKKGISILKSSNARVRNMRALGFSLPSQKNFGFGTLCFTWRNIANNTPLIFWYAGGGFFPLFVKNQTNI